MGARRNGLSAKDLQRIMGFGSYKTARSWLRKLRAALVQPDRKTLSEDVEIEEIFIGGKRPGKPMVLVAVERAGRVRLAHARRADERDRKGRGNLRPAKVARLLPGVAEEWIVLEDGTRVTPGHRYLTEHGTWATAADLIASDMCAVAADGSLVPLRGTLLRATDAGSDAEWITPEQLELEAQEGRLN